MGKATKRKAPPVIQPLDGPTPEQIAKGGVEREDFIHADLGQRVTAYVKRSFEDNGRVYRMHHLDRLKRAGEFTDEQYAAGEWYREQYAKGRYEQPKMANLHRVQGGNILSHNDWTQIARDRWRAARMAFPADMLGFMDAFLLRNRWPKMHHRERFRTLSRIREALDALAHHIRTNGG